MTERDTYLSAARAFAALIERVPNHAWDQPGLGVWTIRELTGHASTAALSSVIAAIARPATEEVIATPQGYYALARTVDPAIYSAAVKASEEGAREEAAALGDPIAAGVQRLVDQVTTTLDEVHGDPLVETAAGGMRLDAWLPTRTFELAVHSIDIATSGQLPADLPEAVISEAAQLAACTAVVNGDGIAVLKALTGRRQLPAGYSIV
jgi:uncharacterized protein (TIGR03083 family)